MRKFTLLGAFVCLALTFVSWGFKGHRTVATIANNHLTPKAKAAIKELLGTESLVDVSTWADEIRNDPQYRKTASWHFLNVPLGLSFQQFSQTGVSLDKENVLTAIQKAENTLSDKATTKEDKREALKFLIHFIGDAHQPMHVSRAEDKGGNTIQVRFDGKGTNLHSLWDSGLIDYSGLSESQLVAKIEKQIKPTDLSNYNSTKPMQWLYESYQLSTNIYKGIEQSNKLDDKYYTANIPLVEERLAAAGLRLAGVLNEIFKGAVVSSASKAVIADAPIDSAIKLIDAKDAANHIGELVSITAKAYSSRDMGSMILVNLGAEYPNQQLTVVLRGEAKSKARDINGYFVKVVGKLIDYKGKAEIIITNPNDLSVVVIVGDNKAKRPTGG